MARARDTDSDDHIGGIMKTVRRKSAGQAMTEYTIVLAGTAVILILSSLDPSPVEALVNAIKSFYHAFSYVISFSN